MTSEPIDTDDLPARLDSMRAEFRAAQQRRYDARLPPPAKTVTVTEPASASDADPPTPATRR